MRLTSWLQRIALVALAGSSALALAGAPAELSLFRFRYASMNGSIAPSMTFCTSVIFSSVRSSFTIVYLVPR